MGGRGMILKKTYANGAERIYTVTSYNFSSDDPKSATLETVENSSVMISEKDTPDLWAQFIAQKDEK
jgi:hypothetical protein